MSEIHKPFCRYIMRGRTVGAWQNMVEGVTDLITQGRSIAIFSHDPADLAERLKPELPGAKFEIKVNYLVVSV